MNFIQELEEIGLSEREAALYLSMAEVGKATAQLLSKRTKMPRASVYLILEALAAKGLVTREAKSHTSYFIPNPPSSITTMLKHEQATLRSKLARSERLSRDLEPLFKGKNFNVPKLKFLEGAESIENLLYQFEDTWYQSIMRRDSTWWGFEDASLYKGYREWFEHMWDKFAEARTQSVRLRIFSNFIVSDYLEKRFPLTKIRPLPTQYDFSSTTWLMGDYLLIFSTREKPFYGYQIHDPVLSENLRIIFKMLWNE